MTMNRWRSSLLIAVTLVIGGCGATGATTSTTSMTPTSPSAVPVSPLVETSSPTPAPTAIPTLASTTEEASEAPAGAIPIIMSEPNANPSYQPDHVTAKAGTVVFFLENVPGTIASPDHNMRIGPAIGQVLAGTPRIRANEKATFTVQDLTPGTYAFWCSVTAPDGNSHAYYGMVGTLTITP
jgi:plastocyanin